MLLINDDQGEVFDRCEDGGARADDHASLATLDAMPLFGALAAGKGGVQDGDLAAEDLLQIGGNSRSEADFGDQQDSGASGGQDFAHSREVDGGFSRAGDSVQQHARKLARFDSLAETG